MTRRVLIALVVLLVLLGVGTLVYATTARTAARVESGQPAPAAVADAEGKSAPVAQSAEVPPPDPNSPLISDIPGCVCHSDDPKIVEEHSGYRMNQCIACHVEGVPTGQK